jgi:hypothetical protein
MKLMIERQPQPSASYLPSVPLLSAQVFIRATHKSEPKEGSQLPIIATCFFMPETRKKPNLTLIARLANARQMQILMIHLV